MPIGAVPIELEERFRGNVAICGLDLAQRKHWAIWSAFTREKNPKPGPLRFINVTLDHKFPPARMKRASYEGYVERGILRTNWLTKHLHLIPAVGVFFFDLDWDAADFPDRKNLLIQNFQRFRRNLSGRPTRFILVLLEQHRVLSTCDEKLAYKRAIDELAEACGLYPKLLSNSEDLPIFIQRLEQDIIGSAYEYYDNAYNCMKAQHELVDPKTLPTLCVRHQFKMGIFANIREDIRNKAGTAVSHYEKAYDILSSALTANWDPHEVKIVAGILMYKIWQRLFERRDPMRSIRQLRRHIRLFKRAIVHPELQFEHYAWLSKQYALFAYLYERSNLSERVHFVEVDNPGFYYSLAAEYESRRRTSAKRICQTSTTYPVPDPLADEDEMRHYGQRSSSAIRKSGRISNSGLSKYAVQALQYNEGRTNYSGVIIDLLNRAMKQFQKHVAQRAWAHSAMLLTDELARSSHLKWNQRLSEITVNLFRQERWPTLLARSLETALRIAYVLANPNDFLALAYEFAGLDCTHQQREDLVRSIMNLLNGQTPGRPFPDLDDNSALWTEKLENLTAGQADTPVFLDMDKIISCISCKAYFVSPSVPFGAAVTLHIYINSQFPANISPFSRLRVSFNYSVYNTEYIMEDEQLQVLPVGCTRTFIFTLAVQNCHVGKEIKVLGVSILLGRPNSTGPPYKPMLQLGWSVNSLGRRSWRPSRNPIPEQPTAESSTHRFNNLPHRTATRIEYRESQLDVSWSSEAPALVDELHPVDIQLNNNSQEDIKELNLTLSTAAPNSIVTMSSTPEINSGSPVTLSLPLIRSGTSRSILVFIKAADAGSCALQLMVTYNSLVVLPEGEAIDCRFHKEDQHVVEVTPGISACCHILNKMAMPVSEVYEGQDYILAVDISTAVFSGILLEIDDAQLQFSPYVNFRNTKKRSLPVSASHMKGVRLAGGESFRSCYAFELSSPKANKVPTAIGKIHLLWRRSSYNHWNSTQVTLPAPIVRTRPI